MNSQDIRDFQNAVYAFANAIGALAIINGMKAENELRFLNNESPAYGYDEFYGFMEERGLHHNSIMKQVYGIYDSHR